MFRASDRDLKCPGADEEWILCVLLLLSGAIFVCNLVLSVRWLDDLALWHVERNDRYGTYSFVTFSHSVSAAGSGIANERACGIGSKMGRKFRTQSFAKTKNREIHTKKN